MAFIDTNILLYAVCPNRHELSKAETAREILLRDDLTLSVQVLQEFYVQATRPSRAERISHADAAALIEIWLDFPVVELSVRLVQTALHLKDHYQVSYWDAAILAAASIGNCNELLSEDLNHGQIYGSVRVVNPFL